jgi:stage 0 sporulation regulatory protein
LGRTSKFKASEIGSEKLLELIDKKRKEMIRITMLNGFASEKAIKCSQELDDILNLHQKTSIDREHLTV